MLHIPAQLERFRFLVACWVHERKHKIIKRWAVPSCIAKHRDYERSVLIDCTRTHMDALKEPLLKPCLPDAVAACPKVVAALKAFGFTSAASALTGRTARMHGRSVQVGDVVLYRGGGPNGGGTDTRVGEVAFQAVLHDQVLVGLSHWPLKKAWTHWIKVSVSNEFCIVPAEQVMHSVIFKPASVGHQSTIFVPARLYQPHEPSAAE